MSETQNKIIISLQKEVFKLMEKLPSDLYYHNIDHTILVFEAVEWLCTEEQVSQEDMYLLKIAALFHDVGFIESYDQHEEKSCLIAEKILSKYKLADQQIECICQLITATKLPHCPVTFEEKIICDADLNYLGGNDFFKIGDRLRKELIHYGKIDKEDITWNKIQHAFLTSHTFHTQTSQIHKEPVKQIYIKQISEKIKKAES